MTLHVINVINGNTEIYNIQVFRHIRKIYLVFYIVHLNFYGKKKQAFSFHIRTKYRSRTARRFKRWSFKTGVIKYAPSWLLNRGGCLGNRKPAYYMYFLFIYKTNIKIVKGKYWLKIGTKWLQERLQKLGQFVITWISSLKASCPLAEILTSHWKPQPPSHVWLQPCIKLYIFRTKILQQSMHRNCE